MNSDDLLQASASNSRASSRASSRANSVSSRSSDPLGLLIPEALPAAPLPPNASLPFSLGHVLNDASASLWFTYLLVYLESTIHLSPVPAGLVLLSGQIADAASTPLMGYLSDHLHGRSYPVPLTNARLCSRSIIHLLSTVLAALSFAGVWILHPSSSPVYFAILASLFNVGWAGVQVTHLALIPDIAADDEERVKLTSYRYSATIASNLLSYFGYLALLAYADPRGENSESKWRVLGTAVLALGGVCNVIFWVGMARITAFRDRCNTGKMGESMNLAGEDNRDGSFLRAALLPPATVEGQDPEIEVPKAEPTGPLSYLKRADFYLTSIVYMFTRLLINIIMVYISFYLLKTLVKDASSIAIIPAVMYVAGFGATLAIAPVSNAKFGRKGSYVLGSAVVCVGCAAAYFVENGLPSFLDDVSVYAVAIILGSGTSLLMVTGVSFVNDLVGDNLGSSAFVYGCMSFTDKLGTGVVVIFIQAARERLCDDSDPSTDEACGNFVREVISFVPAVSCVAACLTMPFLPGLAGGYEKI